MAASTRPRFSMRPLWPRTRARSRSSSWLKTPTTSRCSRWRTSTDRVGRTSRASRVTRMCSPRCSSRALTEAWTQLLVVQEPGHRLSGYRGVVPTRTQKVKNEGTHHEEINYLSTAAAAGSRVRGQCVRWHVEDENEQYEDHGQARRDRRD